MRNIKKFNILYIFLIFILIASSMLGIFAYVDISKNQSTNRLFNENILAVDGASTIAGIKRKASGYDFNQVQKANLTGLYDIDDETYKNKTDYIISDYAGLKAFIGIVNGNDNNHTGWDGFNGKTIYLNTDIDCGGEVICIGMKYGGDNRRLSGATFNGQNHTISNFQLSIQNEHGACGFFLSLGDNCVVENLRLKDVKGHTDGDAGEWPSVTSVLCGYAYPGVSIRNCVVEGVVGQIHGKSTYFASNDFAAIVGVSEYNSTPLTIENCLVNMQNIACVLSAAINDSSAILSIGPHKWTSGYTPNVKISNCVVAGFSANTPLAEGSYVKATNNIKDSQQGSADLSSCSSVGGNIDDVYETWYYGGSQYNGGFPYLRQFVEWWKKVYFTTNGVSVSPESILVPFDARYVFPDSGSNQLYVYQVNIVATKPSNICNHYSVSWTNSSSTISLIRFFHTKDGYQYTRVGLDADIITYHCEFAQQTRNVEIDMEGKVNVSIYNAAHELINPSEKHSFTVYCGSMIKYSYGYLIASGEGYSTLSYTLTDTNGDEYVIKYMSKGAKYYISGAKWTVGGNNGTRDYASIETIGVHDDITLNVEVKLKTYNLVFQ